MRLVLIEDDHLQAEWICDNLRTAIPEATIELLKTESAFLEFIANDQEPVAVYIVDEMLRWADPPGIDDADKPRRPPVGPPQRAGVRIIETLAQRSDTKGTPVILYTVLDEDDVKFLGIRDSVRYVSKTANAQDLVNEVRRATLTPPVRP